MSKLIKCLISVCSIILGYALLWMSWGGVINVGVLINSFMFCISAFLIAGGVIGFFIVLRKKQTAHNY
ncbi:hypothetical protein [Mucilaginibacter sp.]|uniref:hypothetical protein n=1 Tax=Mucilaginibacter sp. TaxID=1882438 RepID=UPI003D0A73FE